jgi:c-di-AMP phosphodiesterase-like protein
MYCSFASIGHVDMMCFAVSSNCLHGFEVIIIIIIIIIIITSNNWSHWDSNEVVIIIIIIIITTTTTTTTIMELEGQKTHLLTHSMEQSPS